MPAFTIRFWTASFAEAGPIVHTIFVRDIGEVSRIKYRVCDLAREIEIVSSDWQASSQNTGANLCAFAAFARAR